MKDSLLDRLFSSRKQRKLAAAQNQFGADFSEWQQACATLASEHQLAQDVHTIACNKLKEEMTAALRKWEETKTKYYDEQALQHAQIDAFRSRYESKEPDAIIEYCERVLSTPDYPTCIPREFDFEFNQETGVLLVECRLPAPEDLPTAGRGQVRPGVGHACQRNFISEAQSARLYEDVLYQVIASDVSRAYFRADSAEGDFGGCV